MSAGGLTYGAAKAILASVVENGVCDDDPRVLPRVNEATCSLLYEIVPVGGMMTVDIVANGTELFLPKEMENAIEVIVLNNAKVNGSRDVTQGWYDVVNQFTYVDPSMQHDNPLVDLFLQPDPDDATIMRRKYDYPGLADGATVRVTGAKRYLPMTSDSDFLIIQNLLALKDEIQAIERMENNAIQEGEMYHQRAVARLQAEVKKHLFDPVNHMRRKAAYDTDLASYQDGTYGYTRAMLAHQVEGALMHGKSELSRMLDFAEMRLMEKGTYKGTLEEFHATITGGEVWFPARVETVLSATVCGLPVPVRSIFFQYLENGPGMTNCGCSSMLIDQGEAVMSDGSHRRKYKVTIGDSENQTLSVCAKVRWVKKAPGDRMTIRNIEALRLMLQSILHERAERWNEALAAQEMATTVLDRELREYLAGVQHTMPQQQGGNIGLQGLGGVL